MVRVMNLLNHASLNKSQKLRINTLQEQRIHQEDKYPNWLVSDTNQEQKTDFSARDVFS